MRRALPYVLIGAMGAAIVLLVVTLRDRLMARERAQYEGSRTPFPSEILEPAPGWLPETLTHDCPKCGKCVHRLALRQHRTLHLRAHYPWTRVVWPADDVWYYGDGVHFAAALGAPTARDPAGEWTYEFSYPAPHDPVPECAAVSKPGRARFSLMVADSDFATPPSRLLPCGVSIPQIDFWFAFHYESKTNERLRRFAWLLEEATSE